MSASLHRSFLATVEQVERLSPSFVRVHLGGEDLRSFGDTCLDQRIKLVLPRQGTPEDPFGGLPEGDEWYLEWRRLPVEERNVFRTYTPAGVDRAAGRLVVDLVVHGDTGPGSRWALAVAAGEPVMVVGPDATVPGHELAGVEWTPGSARRFLLAGDETAVPALVNILSALPPDATGQAFLEVPVEEDVREVAHPPGVDLVWLPRGEGSAHGERLLEAVAGSLAVHPGGRPVEDPTGGGAPDVVDDPEAVPWEVTTVEDDDLAYAWMAAESGAVKALRRHLVGERGWDRRQIAFMGYWKQGVSQV